jgi:UV DNA damage repair endonuclease
MVAVNVTWLPYTDVAADAAIVRVGFVCAVTLTAEASISAVKEAKRLYIVLLATERAHNAPDVTKENALRGTATHMAGEWQQFC